MDLGKMDLGIKYKLAFWTNIAGGFIAGTGVSEMMSDGDYGVEKIIGGLTIGAASIYYRHRCRAKAYKDLSDLEKRLGDKP